MTTGFTYPKPAARRAGLGILALDPGPAFSGLVVYRDGRVQEHRRVPSDLLLDIARDPDMAAYSTLVIESIDNMGVVVGRDVFDTVRLTGRVVEAWWRGTAGWPCVLLPRVQIKMALCGTARAKDAQVRQAIIDLYGGDLVAVGGRRCWRCHGKMLLGRGTARGRCPECSGTGWEDPPGPLHGVASHEWSALAVAIAYSVGAEGRAV